MTTAKTTCPTCGESCAHEWCGRCERVLSTTTRPPFAIPTMDDVRAVPPNGLALVSLFSGCGGSCLGFRQAGFRTLFANEFVPAAADSYRANAADVPLDVRDIRDVRASDVFDVIGHGTQIDVLEGSPPCASFSVAGRLQRGWNAVRDYSDTKQRTDDLFFEFARLLRELRPRVFVAENVAGLLRGVARGFFKDIFRTLQSCGYRVRVELADAQWLGVPQHRERTIFVGVREDLRRDPVFPRPLPYRYSVRDACPHVVRMQHTGIRWRPATLPASTIVASGGTVTPTAQMSGGSFVEVLNARGRVERRRLTIPELRRICTFPEDFVLTGSASQQWERLGRSVPPTMARAFARELAELLS